MHRSLTIALFLALAGLAAAGESPAAPATNGAAATNATVGRPVALVWPPAEYDIPKLTADLDNLDGRIVRLQFRACSQIREGLKGMYWLTLYPSTLGGTEVAAEVEESGRAWLAKVPAIRYVSQGLTGHSLALRIRKKEKAEPPFSVIALVSARGACKVRLLGTQRAGEGFVW